MRISICTFAFICIAFSSFSQSLPDSTSKKIDSLFKQWDIKTSPGCAVAVVRNDSIIYAKGFGMANLEYSIPNAPETIFHMASVSKQFTGYAIVLLAKQGKLKLDDDIRKYLPWFPDMKKKITILHLLNHTSGIRDQWQLLAISGTRLNDVITQDHIVKILSKQKELNFNPGERYVYSNSGYTMLAEIVKSVTGQTLRKFCDSAIFKPLKMNSTHFHDNAEEVVKNRAYSYNRIDSANFANSILSYSNAGATSLFTNANDLSKWIMNFYTPVAGDRQDIEQLTTKGKLNSGKELSYALGIVSDKQDGWKRFSHSGGDAGFRTYMSVFPDLKMGFLVFSNDGAFNPGGKAYEMSRLFVINTAKKGAQANKPSDSSLAIIKDTNAYKKFTGSYISDEGLNFSFKLKDNKMYVGAGPQDFLLSKTPNDTFSVIAFPQVKFLFDKTNGSLNLFENENTVKLNKYKVDTNITVQQLQAYAGTYYCPELDCKYNIIVKNKKLVLTNNKYTDATVNILGSDHITTDHWWMGHLLVTRDANKKITGFKVNDGRVLGLKFNKIN